MRRRVGAYDGPKNNRWLKTLYGFWWQLGFFVGISRRRRAQRTHRERGEGGASANVKAVDTNSSTDIDLENQKGGTCDDSSNES